MKIIIAITLLFVVNYSYSSQTYAPVDVAMELIKISEHCYYVQGQAGIATDNAGFISNAGIVIGKTSVVIIDALGTPSLAWKLFNKIREITDKPISHVLMTHYHADHIYGLQVFKNQGAQIIAPRGSYEYLNSPSALERLEERRFSLEPWVNDDTYLVKPDKMIDSLEKLVLDGITFKLNYLGSAHSTGDLTVYVEEDKVLYSGDIIFEGRIPYVGDADTHIWLNTLKNIENEELNNLVPGHGSVASHPEEAIKLNKDYLQFLRSTMFHAVDNLQPFAEVYEQTDWSKFSNYPAFKAANRRNAYQVYLSLENELMSQ